MSVSGALCKKARAKPIGTQPAQDGSQCVLLHVSRSLRCFGWWPSGCLRKSRWGVSRQCWSFWTSRDDFELEDPLFFWSLPRLCETITPDAWGSTLDTLWSTLGPGSIPGCSELWLAAWLAGRPAGAAGWLPDWLSAWLASWLLGFSCTVRLWEHFSFFRSIIVLASFLRYYRSNWCLERLLWGYKPEKQIGDTLAPRVKPGDSGSWLAGWPTGRPGGLNCWPGG